MHAILGAAASAGDIPVVIHETTGVDRAGDLVLGGLPVPRGEMTGGSWLALRRDDGKTFLVFGRPAAYWPDGSVKWLHICGRVDLAGGEANVFQLAPVAIKDLPASCDARQEGEAMRVRGGLDARIRADQKEMLAVARGGGSVLTGPGVSARMVYVAPDGTNRREYDLQFDGGRPTVVAQAENRVVVRLAGEFLGGDGKAVAEMILFFEFLADLPEVRIEPVWIYLGDPRKDLVESLTLTVHTSVKGDNAVYAFSNERGPGTWDVVHRYAGGPRWPKARMVQLGSSCYRIEKHVPQEDASWLKGAEGERSQGWCHLGDEGVGVTAALRYFWQEHPHSLAVDCDAGTLTIGLIPPELPPLDLRRYSPEVYGMSIYEAGRGLFDSAEKGARGVAKAFEIMLRFDDGFEAVNARRLAEEKDPAKLGALRAQRQMDRLERVVKPALFFTRPCRVMAAPEHLAASEVLGTVGAVSPRAFPKAEEGLATLADFFTEVRHYRGWYGLMDFGDLMIAYDADRDQWLYDAGGYAWINTEALPDYGLWVNALRSARADWLETAVEMSRHNRDVDIYARGPMAAAGTRHNVNHWGDPDKEWRISMPLTRRLHYYVTADEWTKESILDVVKVYQSYERESGTGTTLMAATAGALAKSEMTGDPADVQVLSSFADTFARCVRDDGQVAAAFRADLATGVGGPAGEANSGSWLASFGAEHVMVQTAELLDHQALSAAVVRYAERTFSRGGGEKGNYVKSLGFLGHAWRATSDEKFRRAAAGSVERWGVGLREQGGDSLLDVPRRKHLHWARGMNKDVCNFAGVLQSLPYGLVADFATTEAGATDDGERNPVGNDD